MTDKEILAWVRANRGKVESRICAALRKCIEAHGPITKDFLSSAAKRVVGFVFIPILNGEGIPKKDENSSP